jgi:hypothetical protein
MLFFELSTLTFQETDTSVNLFLEREPKHIVEKRQPIQQMLLGKLDIYL